jgi:hypothetical protein
MLAFFFDQRTFAALLAIALRLVGGEAFGAKPGTLQTTTATQCYYGRIFLWWLDLLLRHP